MRELPCRGLGYAEKAVDYGGSIWMHAADLGSEGPNDQGDDDGQSDKHQVDIARSLLLLPMRIESHGASLVHVEVRCF
jgi:hypothetical protein